jgi:hypothetical protein
MWVWLQIGGKIWSNQTYIFAFLFHQINMVVKKLEHYPN